MGGGYAPVTSQVLLDRTFSHRTGGEKFDFTWTFEGTRFVVDGDHIPPDLSVALLGTASEVNVIEGSWHIEDGQIEFAVDTGEHNEERKSALRIFNTGVVRIETAEAQYVF